MKLHTRYVCETCGTEYETEGAARYCEAQGIEPQPAQVGDTVFVRERYGVEDETRMVVSAKVVGSYASQYLDLPDLERISPHLCLHRWELEVDKPVQWGKGEDSYHTLLVSFSFERNGEKRNEPVRPAPPSPSDWHPLTTAPERRKVVVTWVNSLGNRRTALASFWPKGTLDMGDDVPEQHVDEDGKNCLAGWWEESEGNEDAMFPLNESFDAWMPLPAPPSPDTEPEP